MGKPLRRVRLALACFILYAIAGAVSGQTWPSRFYRHEHNISPGGGGPSEVSSQPDVLIPFSIAGRNVTGAYGTMTGTVRMRYPNALPEARGTGEVGSILVLATPVTVGYQLEFDYVADSLTPPETVHSLLEHEIDSLNGNSPCKRELRSQHQSGTTTHFSESFECTFSHVKVFGGVNPEWVIGFQNFIEFISSSSRCSFCGFLGQIYASYRTYSPLDLTVSRIEVAQVTQDIDNSVRLVADKATLARVFVGLGSEAVQPPQVTGILRGLNAAGAELPRSPLRPVLEPIRAVNRPTRTGDDAFTFLLPPEWTVAGTITLRAEVNPNGSVAETDRTNNVREQTAVFLPRNEFAVRYMPICYLRADDTDGSCPSSYIGSESEKMERMFPVGDGRLSYSRLDVPRWIWPYRFQTEGDFGALTARLRLRYEMANDGSIDQLVGWMPDIRSLTGGVLGSSDPLWAGGSSTGRVSWVMSAVSRDAPGRGLSANLLAHEVGHNLGLRHTNTEDCGRCKDPNTDWPDPTSGRIHEVGFDPNRGTIIHPSVFDVMTYRNNPGWHIWISPFHYNKLFDGHFRPMAHTTPQSAAETTYSFVTGFAKRDGSLGSLDPIVTFSSPASPPASLAEGNHCIRFSGATGTLSDFCFELGFHAHPGEIDLEEEYFALRIPFPTGATRASLRRGSVELAARTASANAPTVTITRPTAGETWAGRRSVSWQGSDADGDALTYTVLYSADGGTKWLPIETDTTSTEFAFDTAEIASGDRVHFRVLASDGFRTAEAAIGPLTVVAAPIIGVQGTADFGSVKLGTFGETNLLITNRGKKALTVGAIRSSLTDFAVRDSLPLVLAPDGTRALTLRFTPAAEGVRTATLSFDSDDPARPTATSSLVGAGLADPQFAGTPSSLDFGAVAVGASRDLTVTVRNTGRGALRVLAIGSSNSQFTVTSAAPPLTIAEGGQIQATVSFRPAGAGLQTGSLFVATATPGVSIALTGTGTGTGTGCQQGVSPASQSAAVEGGARVLAVTAPPGCAWTASVNVEWITITSGANSAGNGTVSLSVSPNSGTPRTAIMTIGNASAVIFQGGGPAYAVVPAVASTPGALGSFFKTSVQLHNPTNAPISGDLTYHPAGISAEAEDQVLQYRIEAGQTLDFADLLPAMQQSGLGSADLAPRTGSVPVATIRVFNDAGEAGTTGMTEELVRPGEALEAGKIGILIAPPEPSRARFNIGVRSLGFGAAFNFTVRDASGAVRTTGSKFFAPSYFAQQSADAFLGIALLANDTISFAVTGGSVIIYGATTDNTTQDPSLQFARGLRSGSDPRRTIAAVAAAPGVNESLFKTTLQIHNPGTTAISGRLIFHPAATSGSDADPSVPYTLAPGATVSYADILAVFQRTGLGSLDLVSTTGPVPLTVARVFNDGGVRGTTGFSIDALRPEDALQSGQTGVLIAPADTAVTRFNVGIRTLADATSVTILVRNRDGVLLRTIPRVYPSNYFEQVAGAAFAGGEIGPSDTVTVTLGAGSAIVYGASTDNKTQDPAMQVARPLAP